MNTEILEDANRLEKKIIRLQERIEEIRNLIEKGSYTGIFAGIAEYTNATLLFKKEDEKQYFIVALFLAEAELKILKQKFQAI